MKSAVIPRGLCGFVLVLLVTGCGTLDFSPRQPSPAAEPSAEQEKSQRTADALAHYSAAIIANEAGDSDEAFRRYEEAVRLDPANSALKLELAVGYLHRNRYEEMDRLVDEIIKSDPTYLKAYQLKALGLRVRGRNAEAIEPLNQAIKLDPGESLHYLELASIQLRLDDLDTAMQILEHALDDVTNRLDVFRALGELYLRQAAEIQKRGKKAKLPEAPLEMLKLGTQEFPDDTQLLNLHGDLLAVHGRLEEAIDVYTRLEELNPDDLELQKKLAISLVSTGDRTKAIALLEDIAGRRPDNYRLWFYLAELHQQETNTDRALECYQRAIDVNPKNPEGYIRKSYLLINLSRNDEASTCLQEGLKTNPHDLRIIEMLAYVHMTQGAYAEAVALFKSAEQEYGSEESSPLLSNFYLNFAIACQLTGDTDEALRLIRKGAESNPDFINDFLAVSFRNRGDKTRLKTALALLDPLQDLIPRTSTTYTLYGLLALNAEEYAAALSLFERAELIAKEDGNDEDLDSQFYFWLGSCAERVKDYDRAEEYFLTAIAREPDHADSHNYLAYMNAERGVKLEDALDHAGVALAIEPENPAYIDTRGWIYYRMGRYDEALADVMAAAVSMPDDPTIAEHLGDIYAAIGDDGKAVEFWQRALEGDPENAAIKAKLNARGAPTAHATAPEDKAAPPAAVTSDVATPSAAEASPASPDTP